MRSLRQVFVLLVIFAALWGNSAYAETSQSTVTVTENYFTATVTNGEATITDWTGYLDEEYMPTALTIPASISGYPVTAIGEKAFDGLAVRSISIPEGVRTIGGEAFYATYCPGTVTIPSSVTSIGAYAFSYMSVTTAFAVADGNTAYCARDGVLFSKDMKKLYNYPLASSRTSYIVPDSVTLLYCTSFANAANLTDITVWSPSIRAMGFTFYGDTLKLWCRPGTDLSTQISGKTINFTDVTLGALPCCSVEVSGNDLSVTLARQLSEPHCLVAAYLSDGRMASLVQISGSAAQTITLHGAGSAVKLKLFRLDALWSSNTAAEALWTKSA